MERPDTYAGKSEKELARQLSDRLRTTCPEALAMLMMRFEEESSGVLVGMLSEPALAAAIRSVAASRLAALSAQVARSAGRSVAPLRVGVAEIDARISRYIDVNRDELVSNLVVGTREEIVGRFRGLDTMGA